MSADSDFVRPATLRVRCIFPECPGEATRVTDPLCLRHRRLRYDRDRRRRNAGTKCRVCGTERVFSAQLCRAHLKERRAAVQLKPRGMREALPSVTASAEEEDDASQAPAACDDPCRGTAADCFAAAYAWRTPLAPSLHS
jgi:hypothetical protein